MKLKFTPTDDKGFFVYAVVSIETAEEIFEFGKTELFKLYDDDSEALIQHESEIIESPDIEYGISLGFINELESDWQEASARNNEKRSFEAWLEDKANNLIE